jgi:hypothetical protein
VKRQKEFKERKLLEGENPSDEPAKVEPEIVHEENEFCKRADTLYMPLFFLSPSYFISFNRFKVIELCSEGEDMPDLSAAKSKATTTANPGVKYEFPMPVAAADDDEKTDSETKNFQLSDLMAQLKNL